MRKRTKGRWITPLLAVFLFLESLICAAAVAGEKESFQYGMDYECSPLKIRQLMLIDRQDSKAAFLLDEGERLYEVRVTYENYGDFTAEYFGRMDFISEQTGEYCAEARRVLTDENIGYLMRYMQVIPAGETGTFRYFLAVPEGAESLRVTDRGEKLNGDEEAVTVIELPGQKQKQTWASF